MPLDELHRRQRRKNITLALVLVALVALLFAISIMKMSG